MKSLYLLFCFLVASLAAPISNETQMPQKSLAYFHSVDTIVAVTSTQFRCLSDVYDTIFSRCYKPDSGGTYDTIVGANVRGAQHVYLGVELYMTPAPMSSKSGAKQADEVMTGLGSQEVKTKGLWVQVTSPTNWYSDYQTNINFINTVLNRLRSYGIAVGIYTSSSEWNQITGNYRGVGDDVPLWYWHIDEPGPNGETSNDFSDFVPFASWYKPTAKQYGQQENVCGFPANKDVYILSDVLSKEDLPMRARLCKEGELCKHTILPENA